MSVLLKFLPCMSVGITVSNKELQYNFQYPLYSGEYFAVSYKLSIDLALKTLSILPLNEVYN